MRKDFLNSYKNIIIHIQINWLWLVALIIQALIILLEGQKVKTALIQSNFQATYYEES